MKAERAAKLVALWVRLYSRRLPAPLAARRAQEIAADVHDHVAHERAAGVGERSIALALLARMARGVPADLAWGRRHAVRSRRLTVARATALILLVPLIAMQFSDEVAWTPSDFVFAALLLSGTGLMLRHAGRLAGGVPRRLAARAGVVAVFLLLWVNLAVGIVGEPGDRFSGLLSLLLLVLWLTTAVLLRRNRRDRLERRR